MIICGHCQEQHETVAEVRDCARVSPAAPKEIDLSIPDPPVPPELSILHEKVMAIFGDGKLARDEWPKGELAPEGFYRVPVLQTEYDYVKVQLNQNGSRRYAKRLHIVQELVDGKVEVTSAIWEYEPGLINKIKPSHVLTEEQAAEFGKLYGWCCICGRRLTNEESIDRGIGPVCAGKQGW